LQHVWSYAGDESRRNVSETLIQPFLNYNMDGGWYLTTSPVLTANWKSPDTTWTVPVGGGIGKILRLGKLPVNMQLQAYDNVVKPDAIGDWTVRFQIQLLFPAG
jgi:hypothetical protein